MKELNDKQEKMQKAANAAAQRLGTVKTAKDVAMWFAAYKNESGIKNLAKRLMAYHKV